MRRSVPVSLLLILFIPSITVAQEEILSKEDTDRIFSLDRAGWEASLDSSAYPEEWVVRFSRHDTGTAIMAFDSTTGFGLTVQPLYESDDGPPTMLVVGSYFPLGSLPPFTDDQKKGIEKDAVEHLGPRYSVSAFYYKNGSREGIELTITRNE